MPIEKWIVGEEYDDAAFALLKRALARLHYDVRNQFSAIAGSQDIQQWTVVGPKGQLLIQRETYAGLLVEGMQPLMAELKAEYARKV